MADQLSDAELSDLAVFLGELDILDQLSGLAARAAQCRAVGIHIVVPPETLRAIFLSNHPDAELIADNVRIATYRGGQFSVPPRENAHESIRSRAKRFFQRLYISPLK